MEEHIMSICTLLSTNVLSGTLSMCVFARACCISWRSRSKSCTAEEMVCISWASVILIYSLNVRSCSSTNCNICVANSLAFSTATRDETPCGTCLVCACVWVFTYTYIRMHVWSLFEAQNLDFLGWEGEEGRGREWVVCFVCIHFFGFVCKERHHTWDPSASPLRLSESEIGNIVACASPLPESLTSQSLTWLPGFLLPACAWTSPANWLTISITKLLDRESMSEIR